MDPAVSELATGDGRYRLEGADRTSEDMVAFWTGLLDRFPIVSIEDPLGEDDWQGWTSLVDAAGARRSSSATISSSRTSSGSSGGSGALRERDLVKVNQIGTLTETLDAIALAQRSGFGVVVSHRSGETEDTTIADLAVATNAGRSGRAPRPAVSAPRSSTSSSASRSGWATTLATRERSCSVGAAAIAAPPAAPSPAVATGRPLRGRDATRPRRPSRATDGARDDPAPS